MDFEKKMRNVFVTIITITINNSKLEGYWTLQATGLLLQLPKRLAFVPIIFYRNRVRSLGMLVSNSLTHSLTDCCLVNLIDVTLACEHVYSKLVADVSDEDRVGNSLLQIWKPRFGHNPQLVFRL